MSSLDLRKNRATFDLMVFAANAGRLREKMEWGV